MPYPEAMLLGATFPQAEIGADPAEVRAFAQAAEDLGYDYLLVYDHVLGASRDRRPRPLLGPYDHTHPFHEPFVLYGYLAAVTELLQRIRGAHPTKGLFEAADLQWWWRAPRSTDHEALHELLTSDGFAGAAARCRAVKETVAFSRRVI